MTDKQTTERPRPSSGPMTEVELELLRDIQGFLDFAIRNGLSFRSVMSTLSQDVDRLHRYRFDLEAATNEGFVPQVSGLSQIDEDAVGEPEEPDDSEASGHTSSHGPSSE